MKEVYELNVYQLAEDLSDLIWYAYDSWPEKVQRTTGYQIIRSSDSIAANIAEGHGRFHYQENIQFCRQTRGSLMETKDHLIFIKELGFIKKVSSIDYLLDLCEQTRMKLNGYIGYLKICKKGEQQNS